jgi:hypothetical protein
MKDTKIDTVIVRVLQKIEHKYGCIQPEQVVHEAESPSSPLHERFDWDDNEAAVKWRLQQARVLIQRVRVEIGGEIVQAYHNVSVQVNDQPMRGYYSTERVLSDDVMLQQVMARALMEIEYWQKKYNTIKELSRVINHQAVAELKSKVSK